MKTIKFGLLPREFHIGSRRVIPRSPLCRDLKACIKCDLVTTEFMQCAEAHVTCRSCYSEPRRSALEGSDDGLEIWCRECHDYVPAVRTVISNWFLKILEFACNCGFEGTLNQMKRHLESSSTKCLSDGAKREMAKARDIKAMTSIRRKLNELEENIRDHGEILQGVEAEVTEMTKIVAKCRSYPAKLRTILGSRGLIFLECEKRTAAHGYTFAFRNDGVFHVQGLPLWIKPTIEAAEDGKLWLSILVARASFQEGIPRTLHISLKLHDKSGGIVKEKHIDTYDFSKKKFIHRCFEHTDESAYVFAKLIRQDEFENHQIVFDNRICISFEIRPQNPPEPKK